MSLKIYQIPITTAIAGMKLDPDYEQNVSYSISFTVGEDSYSIDVITLDDFLLCMRNHADFKFVEWWDPDDFDDDYPEPVNYWAMLYETFGTYMVTKFKPIYDWIVDIYTKLDPIMTGWKKVTANDSYNQYGYTDTRERYIATSADNSKTMSITCDSARKPAFGTASDSTLKHTVTESSASDTFTRLGKTASGVSVSNGTVNATIVDGANPNTKVWTGTFDSTAQSPDMPLTNQQESVGDTATVAGTGRSAEDKTEGSVLTTAGETVTGGRNYNGTHTRTEETEQTTGDVVEAMKKYVREDITKLLLDEFCARYLFYNDTGD